MKIKVFTILFFCFVIFVSVFIFLPFISADIISLNSGGDQGLIINPDNYIEGFFLDANRFPVVYNVILNSSSATNTTNENLSVYYSGYDLDYDSFTNITDWRVGGSSVAVLNMAFDKRIHTGEVRDYSTYENNGTLGNGVSANEPTWVKDCQVGGCYEFDGVDDRVGLNSLNGFVSPVGTISYWIKLNDKDDAHGVYHFYETSTSNYIRTYIGATNNMDLVIEDDDVVKVNVYYDLDNLGDYVGDWIFVSWTQNGTSVQLYINGQEKTLSGTNSGSWWTNHLTFSAGNLGLAWTYLNGSLDEFQVYNRSLSPQQISALYQAGVDRHHFELLVSQETDKGETWQVAITPNDVFDDGITVLSNTLTIENAVPNNPEDVTLVSLNERNESDTDLNCSAFVSDSDDDDFTVDVRWYKDNISQFDQEFTSQNNATTFWTLLDNGNLTLGDFWICSVRIYDGADFSNWVNSSYLEIIDITSPNITIISPNSSMNYTTLDIDFNISISENENVSWCGYNINETTNITMIRFNDSYFWYEPNNLIPGTHNVTFYCNDTSGNLGTNFTNFTILDEAAIAIQLSPSLAWNVNWSLEYLPVDDLHAVGNNELNETDYWVNISATNVNVDLYVRADGDLLNDALDALGLGNETFCVNITNSSVPDLNRFTMNTTYILIGDNLPDETILYLKFYLDAPASQPAGTYLNNLGFKAVSHGVSV